MHSFKTECVYICGPCAPLVGVWYCLTDDVQAFISPPLPSALHLNVYWPAEEKNSWAAMRGAAVLLVTFLGGASALTGSCQNWYAHPRACHWPCGRNTVVSTPAGCALSC
jgi:hypothetical protein